MVNLTILVGRLGKDPKLTTVNSKSVLSFSVATSKSYNKNGEWKSLTTWHDVQVWEKLADSLATKLQKGDLVFVQGATTKRDGKNREGEKVTYVTVRAERVIRLNKRDEITPPAEAGADPFAGEGPATEGEDPFADAVHGPSSPAADDEVPF